MCCVLSIFSNSDLDEVAETWDTGVLPWFQLSVLGDREYSATLVKKAEELNYK